MFCADFVQSFVITFIVFSNAISKSTHSYMIEDSMCIILQKAQFYLYLTILIYFTVKYIVQLILPL